MATLSELYNNLFSGNLGFTQRQMQLPNDMGTYTTQVPATPYSAPTMFAQKSAVNVAKSSAPVTQTRPVTPVQTQAPAQTIPGIDPFFLGPDGKPLPPDQAAAKIAAKMQGRADVPQYAGNLLTQPEMNIEQQQVRAMNMRNAANDIATGATDPYKVASQSGIAYSPQELAAIEKAYSGIYDPALNSAIAKLDAAQKLQQEQATLERQKELESYRTNENIRQWKATTGSEGGGGKTFTQSQINKGASEAGMTIDDFNNLTTTMKNFYINQPKGIDPKTNKSQTIDYIFKDAIKDVANGDLSAQELRDEINSSNLPEEVKQYYINLIPEGSENNPGYFSNLWSALTGK